MSENNPKEYEDKLGQLMIDSVLPCSRCVYGQRREDAEFDFQCECTIGCTVIIFCEGFCGLHAKCTKFCEK